MWGRNHAALVARYGGGRVYAKTEVTLGSLQINSIHGMRVELEDFLETLRVASQRSHYWARTKSMSTWSRNNPSTASRVSSLPDS